MKGTTNPEARQAIGTRPGNRGEGLNRLPTHAVLAVNFRQVLRCCMRSG
jgi:hypothetical protein